MNCRYTLLPLAALLPLAVLPACGDSASTGAPAPPPSADNGAPGLTDPDTSTSTTDPADTGATAPPVSSSQPTNSGAPGTTAPTPSPSGPVCGNGVVEAGEACDDGPDNSDQRPDACRTDCTLPTCGDGVTDSGEECDDGPDNSDQRPDACRTNCALPTCGDGVTDSGEECDRGPLNGADGSWCSEDCTFLQERACPNHDILRLVEDGTRLTGAFAWRIDATLDGSAGQASLDSSCDDRTLPAAIPIAFTADIGGRYEATLDNAPDNLTLLAARTCGDTAIACADDFTDEAPDDGPFLRTLLRDNTPMLLLVADRTGDGGAFSLTVRRTGTLVD